MTRLAPARPRPRSKPPAPARAVAAAPTGPSPAPTRDRALDVLRGIAIMLMVLDHVAAILGHADASTPVRIVTRLAEPLFAVLLGALLHGATRARTLRRLPRLLLAAVLVNLLFFAAFGRLEVLASFLVVLLLYIALGRHIVWLAPLALVQRWDPTGVIFDYPLAMVASQVALGVLSHRKPAWLCLVAAALPIIAQTPRGALVQGFTVMALALILAARRWPGWRPVGPLTLIGALGRYPLRIYVLQFVVIFALAVARGDPSGRALVAAWGGRPTNVPTNARTNAPSAAVADPLAHCLGPSLPLKRQGGLVLAPASVDDAAGSFVIDFATNRSTLDPRGLDRAVHPIAGTADRYARVDFFAPTPEVVLLPQDMAAAGAPGAAGILGTDLLARGAITIDWTAGRIHRAAPDALCDDRTLLVAGLRPLSTVGFYTEDASRLKGPNVPTVPIAIGGVAAVAQIDTAYDDSRAGPRVNINRPLLDALVAAGVAIERTPAADVSVTTCTGATLPLEAWALPAGAEVALIGIDRRPVRTVRGAQLFLKQETDQTRACGGIGVFPMPAAQLGVSVVASAGRMVVDARSSLVWLPKDLP